ncbi:MAG TPA: hypothetical protein VKE96_21990 [Vicinamibacterales bacterium]|nr:hypothetical protein [Vicinamibacterales bacterium]
MADRRRVYSCIVTRGTACTLTAGFVALAVAGVLADSRDSFAVGVLRRDGIVLPFAVFDGKRWNAPWPGPTGDLTVPIDVRAVPKRWWGVGTILASWEVILTGGTRAVRVLQPDWVDIACSRYVGLKTDYQPPETAPPRTVQPYPKEGLAVSPPHAVERVEIVSLASNEIRALMPVVQQSFNEAEREVESRFGHPITRRAREGIAPTLEAIYAYGDSPRIYYIEAIRPYRRLGQNVGDCAAIGSGTGWFVRDAAGVRSLTMVVDVLNCQREAASYMLPLGVLKLNDHLYWLAQFAGWGHERYVVLEVKKKVVEVVINKWGGGC